MTTGVARPLQVAVPLPSEQVVANILGMECNPDNILNVLKMFAGTGDLYTATDKMVTAIFSADGIDAKLREMIIIRAAKSMNCQYALAIGPVLGRNAGLSDDEIAAALADDPVSHTNAQYTLLCRATDELSTTATLSDETLSEMLARYDDTMCRKLILMISWFNLVNRFENGCRVPLERAEKIAHMSSPV